MERVAIRLHIHVVAALMSSVILGCVSQNALEENTLLPETKQHHSSELSAKETQPREEPTSFHFVHGQRFRKTTSYQCSVNGGEFFSHPNIRPDDMVDCLLPAYIRKLGGHLTYLAPREILGSVYDYLYRAGVERPHYGLYSYVLVPFPSARAEHFFEDLFKTTSYVELNRISLEHINIIYLPVRETKIPALLPIISDGSAPPANLFVAEHYDYALATKILTQICVAAPENIKEVCSTDLSRGPYLFTFPHPASELTTIPPPFLFVDLSNAHERAFGEFLAAYREQVKRTDHTDLEKIDGLRLGILNVILNAADWIDPIRAALAGTIHMSTPESAD